MISSVLAHISKPYYSWEPSSERMPVKMLDEARIMVGVYFISASELKLILWQSRETFKRICRD
jgi:hypothetical protein